MHNVKISLGESQDDQEYFELPTMQNKHSYKPLKYYGSFIKRQALSDRDINENNDVSPRLLNS